MSGDIVFDDRAFRAGLARAMRRIELSTEKDLARFGIRVQNEARQRCPVDTGRLRASIQTSGVQHDGRGAYIEVGTNVGYAGFVEFGTRYMRAQPYMRPALLAAAQGGLR